jgi:hypothetical protein
LGEDALHAGAVVAAHPPVLVHVLVHVDLVVLFQAQVATIGGLVAVQGPGMGQDGPAGRRARGEVGGRSVLVRGRRRRGTVDVEILEGLDRRRRGRCRLSGSLGGRASRAAGGSSAKGRFGGKGGVDRVEGSFVDDAFFEEALQLLFSWSVVWFKTSAGASTVELVFGCFTGGLPHILNGSKRPVSLHDRLAVHGLLVMGFSVAKPNVCAE